MSDFKSNSNKTKEETPVEKRVDKAVAKGQVRKKESVRFKDVFYFGRRW